MANHRDGAANRDQARQERQIRTLESRTDRLETDLESVLEGAPLRPEPLSRNARLSRALILGGALLILAAVVLAIV